MNAIWGAYAAAAMGLATPAMAAETAPCAISRPADGDLKAHAARLFPAADSAAIDTLLACLGDPDPAVRDGFAFTLWSEGLRGGHVSPALLRHANMRLQATLAEPDDSAGFRKPFAALALSEVARADRIAPFLSQTELHALAASGAAYLRRIRDYRGFVVGEGWRHGVAHGADLMLQLALNPRLVRADADLLLGAVAAQVAPAGPVYYVHGEPGRLARPILYLAKRPDIDDAAWAAWFKTLHPDTSARWKDPYAGEAGLAAVHNSSAFAQTIYVSASESADEQIKRLAPLAVALIKALP
ncbi:hypothetical protein BWQ93_16835 [Sphingopyxis sp. QXT-31]|uniref:DUF2785 domain-containing protein n=1 Tax=Sphingopyxis sp. QXT-31 TaxID=1357916 RepID=UPI0009793B57|nr:DUF2785 domain-containing protein [Sphingopyxis sp. QXT-31]APZ99962.1 hypothetical protein BWQ93_16835 [Sphingopyxis sp. QXT-31]